MKHPVDILQELVTDFQSGLIFNGQGITKNADGTYTITACKTFHLQECFNITIDGVNYEITEVIDNVSVTLKGTIAPPLTFSLNEVYFFAGEVRATNVEMQAQARDVSDRTPFVFASDRFEESRKGRESSIGSEFTMRLFWLTQCDFRGWKQSDHRNKAIKPMRNLIDEFIKYLHNRGDIGYIEEHRLIDRPNFGIYNSEKGQEALYFNDFLSGTELIISLSIMKNYECKC